MAVGLADRARVGRASLRHRELELDEVDAVDQLGDGVLDLQAGVHLEEEEAVGLGVVQELDGAGAPVVDRCGGGVRGLVQSRARLVRQPRSRRLLDHLLVATLDRAVALAEDEDAARVADDLHLHVARVLDVRLEEHGPVAEGALRLGARRVDLAVQVVEGAHDPHAAAATACRRLHQQGQVGLPRLRRALEDGYAGLPHQLLGSDLGAHLLDRPRRRTDPDQTGVGHGAREVGVLGQEAVARMHRVGAGSPSRVDEQVDPQVGVGRSAAGQVHGGVGLADVGQPGIRVGVHRHRLDAEAAAGREHPPGDLATVGHQESLDHGTSPQGSGSPRRCSRRSEAGE